MIQQLEKYEIKGQYLSVLLIVIYLQYCHGNPCWENKANKVILACSAISTFSPDEKRTNDT